MPLIAIPYSGLDTLSLRQLDTLNGVNKGTTFRAFKACLPQLQEGEDYFYLPADEHRLFIDNLKSSDQIYATTVHLVLLTRQGYEKIRLAVTT